MENKSLFVLFGLIVLISIIDIFANIISFIPVIGDLAETASETVMEAIQLVLVGILAAVAKRGS
jgi:uncharacterized membrane protein